MSDYGHFLSRWSRRKGQAQRAGTKVCAPDPIGGDKPTSQSLSDQARSNDRGAESTAELHVKELALLPRIEDMTAATDLTQFLRNGVSTALRNAALRRMWTLDPAIRDYVSEAREYAYDWNSPGAIPGAGPILAQDFGAMVARIAGQSPLPSTSPSMEEGTPILHHLSQARLPEIHSHDVKRSETPHGTSALVGAGIAASESGADPASEIQRLADPHDDDTDRLVRRRHGSAVPT